MSENDVLGALMSQYESNKSSAASFDNSVDFSKYYTPRLEDDEKSGESQIRLMPPMEHWEQKSPFQMGYWHSIQVGGKWRKLYCNKHNGVLDEDGTLQEGTCPLCDTEAALKDSGKKQDTDLAKTYRAKKFYVARVIDRNKEEDGIKFWRFPHNFKGEGAIDKIIPIFTKKGDISAPREGRDLVIMLNRDDKGYTKITSIMSEDPSTLTDDKPKAKAWMGEKMEWRNLYKPQAVEYLELIANGETPVWDKGLKKFVAKGEETTTFEAEVSVSNVVSKPAVTESKAKTDDDDEMPF